MIDWKTKDVKNSKFVAAVNETLLPYGLMVMKSDGDVVKPEDFYKDLPTTQLDRIESKLDKLLERKKPKLRSSNKNHHVQFQVAWGNLPKRVGNNPKNKALAAYLKRHSEGATYDELNFAATAYCAFCDATIEDKQYVMQAATFYGCNKPYEGDWTIPIQADTLPKDNEHLVTWAEKKGYRGPYIGESFPKYRQYLEGIHGVQS